MATPVSIMTPNAALGTIGQPTESVAGTPTNPIYTQGVQGATTSATKLEDTQVASGDAGSASLWARNDLGISTSDTDRDYTQPAVDRAGRNLSKPFAAAEADWASGPITVTASNLALKAAGGAAVRNFMTAYVITTGSTWTANTLQFQDGTTVKFEIDLPAGAGVYAFAPLTPIVEGTANTAINIKATGAVTGTAKVNALGYSGV